MNAGAYDREIRDVAVSTTAFEHGAGIFTVKGEEHDFSYRSSRFSDTGDIILSSALRLEKGDAKKIREKMSDLQTRRRGSQPLELPSAGSVFKRPKEGYAAALIEQAGLKGFSIGGAQVSTMHSGFIVNRGGAAFADVMAVIEYVREAVFKQCGIVLETEIKIIRG